MKEAGTLRNPVRKYLQLQPVAPDTAALCPARSEPRQTAGVPQGRRLHEWTDFSLKLPPSSTGL
ncbi:hypothetical protein NQZ68_021722 [Dissostichus eleginoides]|nr:hypothetical protein NQZ68_021722 [Dissostichus eleginoides]